MHSSNHIRNILVFFCGLFCLLEFCFYISGVFFVLLVWGVDYLDFNAINPSVSDFPMRLWPTIFQYISKWWGNPKLFGVANSLKLWGSFFAPIGLVCLVAWNLRHVLIDWRPFKKKESLHGDSRWASERDIRKIGLRSRRGILLGKDQRGYLVADGYQHALLFAPTGSGKGVGFVIPNLLFWEDSVIVHDVKLENYDLTSGWRKKIGQEVYVWNPAQPDGISHCYNPLDWISKKPGQMVDDVQKIANLIMPEQDFWYNEARSLFVGVVLYLLAVPEKVKSFGEVVRTMRSDDVVYNLAVVLDTIGKKIHPVAYMNIAAFLQKADKERSGVISTMNSSLELWANPLIDTATASSDFNIQDFKRKRVSVYVGVTPDNLTRLRPLMQVFYQQATEFLCRSLPSDDEPYGVLFLMDEFPTLGKMEQFQTGIAYFRGYRVRLFLIIQDTEQLKGIYEEAGMNSFLSNSTYRITFAANNIETANLISQLIGNKTVSQESLNRPKFLDLNPASRSLHISDTQRALLLPQEVIMLPKDEQILLIESTYPIKSRKIKYFEDKTFTRRLLKSTFIPTQEPYDPEKIRGGVEGEAGIVSEASENSEDLKALMGSSSAENPPERAEYGYEDDGDLVDREEFEDLYGIGEEPEDDLEDLDESDDYFHDEDDVLNDEDYDDPYEDDMELEEDGDWDENEAFEDELLDYEVVDDEFDSLEPEEDEDFGEDDSLEEEDEFGEDRPTDDNDSSNGRRK
ncbi:type IV secretory system conjugative DNA transfer family protein [Anaplasma phagocytophilum]|uniref:type IV secretory system conjugative DNA transfer family protein n=1 Tax=Anaplasma phagocytophilum TaxID=948 RepID=UPI0007E0154D|nr:type IV secretory system conjugative DNA transfer family protein [Anaplasma phagocytophilum]SBO32554.1 Conjugal transfer protein TraG [Anaplasma phagocytophilum]SBO33094.1 Conjugal transfer protein TraG [Anaplasma phagocytophilum]SBO33098.1 Conjugal transfer protein TraG [Anaplasma phagocytophilum]SCV62396.1 Conjugal transfer protein TraG [Anaplasma phagocytophilum]